MVESNEKLHWSLPKVRVNKEALLVALESDNPIEPVIWEIENDIRFQDLKRPLFDEALSFLTTHYIPKYEMFDSTAACQAYKDYLYRIMQDECSLVAIDQVENRIVGVALSRIRFRNDYSLAQENIILSPNAIVAALISFHCDLVKYSELHKKFGGNSAMHLVLCAIDAKKKGNFLKEKLILQMFKVARSTGVEMLTHIISSANDAIRMSRLGFEVMNVAQLNKFDDNVHEYASVLGTIANGQAILYAHRVGPQHVMSIGDYCLYDS